MRAHIVLDATTEHWSLPKFSREGFWSLSEVTAAFIASSRGSRYTQAPFWPNSMSIRPKLRGFARIDY